MDGVTEKQLPTVMLADEQGKLHISLQHCTPPQAIDILLRAMRALIFQKPQEAKPSLLVPNGRPLPNLRG